ncbi:cutinase family protein [Kineosporia rhizophila]|uniref:cutinase family protein n=1 Tax=Kineosporia rhizophila TaxID=84633 RepID=UPI001E50E2AF|nr:cutinase family protein [Kineosporia rhizophila]
MTRWTVAALSALMLLSACGDDESPSRPPTSSNTPTMECNDYLIVTVRGTGEPLDGSNLLGPVAEQIAAAHPGRTRHYDVPYPASAESLSTAPGDAYFGESADDGVRLVLNELNSAAEQCPQQRSVVMGFSQGALVVGDALISPDRRDAGQDEAELDSRAAENVAAAVVYGDPRFVGSEPFNAGTYDRSVNGMLRPRSAGDLDAFADRLRSYCVAHDFVCQSGGQFDPHISYFTNGMRDEGAQFVLARLSATASP